MSGLFFLDNGWKYTIIGVGLRLFIHAFTLSTQNAVDSSGKIYRVDRLWASDQSDFEDPVNVCLFAWLVFNGTFSTNMLYHAITAGKYIT